MDEVFASPETAALHYEEAYESGLLARADSPSDFHPMSAYAKPPPQSQGTSSRKSSCHDASLFSPVLDSMLMYTPGFDNSRSFSDSFASVQAFTSQAQVAAASTGSFQNAPLVAAMSYSSQSRLPYDDQSGPYLNVGSTPVPQVISYQPVRGAKGTRVDVYISSLYELMTSNAPTFYLMFASRKCSATLSKIDQQGGVCQYIVSAEVPALAATGWQSSQVPLCLLMESGDGELMAKSDVGDFSYLEGNIEQANNLQDVSRKRKISLESAELMKSPIKRASNNHLRLKEESSSYGYTTSEEANFSPYLQPISQYGMMQQYARSGAQYQRQPSHRALHQYQYTNAPGSPSANIKVQSPTLSTWSLYSNVSPQVTPSPGQGVATPMARPSLSSLPSPLPANPPLVRTSTLQQTPSPGTTPAGSRHSGQAFNPYTLYPHKANLKIVGDLDTMAEGWTVDEWAASRRIVMFKRSQSGATITTTFSPVTADERPPKSVCISCIYWEEKSECYVTSVDTIYLLEHLVANRFTTEEKNRIRRNLEHFRPLTVSKSKKPDSEEFFKLIMGFPNPKPRNIEKDVKVFPWKILVHALKKIIGKYVSRNLIVNVHASH